MRVVLGTSGQEHCPKNRTNFLARGGHMTREEEIQNICEPACSPRFEWYICTNCCYYTPYRFLLAISFTDLI